MGPRYVYGAPIRLYGMTDSDWTTRRSTTGVVFFLAGAAIAYLSKKQPTIAMSSWGYADAHSQPVYDGPATRIRCSYPHLWSKHLNLRSVKDMRGAH